MTTENKLTQIAAEIRTKIATDVLKGHSSESAAKNIFNQMVENGINKNIATEIIKLSIS
jgi:hypothetical protein